MNLKNGYKTLFEVVEDGNRIFYASKTTSIEDAVEVASYPVNSVKVIYQDKDHKFYGINKDGSAVNLKAINTFFTEEPKELPPVADDSEKVEAPDEVPGEAVTEPEEKGEEVIEGETEEV